MANRRMILDEEMAPGFSVAPGGNLMYQVATDYPKQMAEIMAEYEARAGDARYNPFGESPDSPRRLEAELTEPFRAVFAASQPQQRLTQPRYFETGGDIVTVDPRTGRASVVYDTPGKNTVEDARIKSEANLLQDEIQQLNRAKLKVPGLERPVQLTDEVIDAQIGDKTAKLNALFTPVATTNAPVVAREPLMAFGGLDAELRPPTPFLNGATNAPASAPAKSKYRVISVK